MTRLLLTILSVILFSTSNAQAQDKASSVMDVSDWRALPILHNGRIKPLDSFAVLTLKSFADKDYVGTLSAAEWLSISMFDPSNAINIPVFKIRDAARFGLIENQDRLYSYSDLAGLVQASQKVINELIEVDPKTWEPEQAELIRHYEHYILYTQILRSLTLLLPMGDIDQETSFLDFKKRQRDLDQRTKEIVVQKGTDIEKYTDEERQISFLSYQLKVLETSAQHNILMRIIPIEWNEKASNFTSPWDIMSAGTGSPKSAQYMALWGSMAQHYYRTNHEGWAQTVTEANSFFNNPKLKIEVLYDDLNFLKIAMILYILTSFMFIVHHIFLFKKESGFSLLNGAFYALLTGIVTHSIHIGLRVYILGRPPVGTLYESVLFVALICVCGFAFLCWKQKSNIGILLGSIAGILLLLTAQGFVGEDTMANLAAVLNTSFWLGTHVLCITIGYGTCLIASLMAHYDLTARWLKPTDRNAALQRSRNLKTMIILSLLFTTVGTILGGIWADQSWGRFWGWDPKENGALLIVLWLAWLLHGRISQHITEVGFVVGSALLSIIVVLAWFGVNLLNVGLHSYGFISGIALGIAAFSVAEIIIVGGLWILGRQKTYSAHES